MTGCWALACFMSTPPLQLLEHALSCTEPASPMSLGPVWYQSCANSTPPNTSGPGCRLLQGLPLQDPSAQDLVTQVPRPSPQASVTTSPYLPLFLFCPSPSASFAFEVLREPNHSWLCPLWKHRRREGLPVLYRLVAHKSCKGGYKAA